MAGARNRRSGVEPVGHLHLLLGGDGCAYVRWSPAEADPGELGRVAVVAAIDWAARAALRDRGWSRRQVSGFLERVCRSASAHDYNVRCGTSEVAHGAPPPGTLGPSVLLDVGRAPEGAFDMQWKAPQECLSVSGAERVLAALWSLAEEGGHTGAVHHALFALRGGFDHSGPFAPDVAGDLVASLVNFGVEMADTDVRAQESRSRLRLV